MCIIFLWQQWSTLMELNQRIYILLCAIISSSSEKRCWFGSVEIKVTDQHVVFQLLTVRMVRRLWNKCCTRKQWRPSWMELLFSSLTNRKEGTNSFTWWWVYNICPPEESGLKSFTFIQTDYLFDPEMMEKNYQHFQKNITEEDQPESVKVTFESLCNYFR